jgi:hypothetical protein
MAIPNERDKHKSPRTAANAREHVPLMESSKGNSPFYPTHPVPVDLFVGRIEEIKRILMRGVGQVAAGKPISIYVQGEYGIGKTSIAKLTQWIAEEKYNLHGIYAALGGCRDVNDVGEAVLEATLRSGAFKPNRSEIIRNWLAKYIGKQELFGFTVNLDELKQDGPHLSTPYNMLDFLGQVKERLSHSSNNDKVDGIFLVLDEIDGIAGNPQFAHYIKGLIDTNAVQRKPLPWLLMLCGVEERRREMIRNHQPVERIFDIVNIETMTNDEMGQFFQKAFASVNMEVEAEALKMMNHYSAGFPKIMHLIGDAAFWIDDDSVIDENDAMRAIIVAAGEVGNKFVEQQVYKALQSKDYISILEKIAHLDPYEMSFNKSDIASGLTPAEQKKFYNFLRRMKKLRVLQSETKGEWVFTSRMVRLYIWLKPIFKLMPGLKKGKTNSNNQKGGG